MPKRSPRGVELLQGEPLTLFPSAARGAGSANGTPLVLQGERSRFLFLLNVTAAATVAGDTLDCFVDILDPSGGSWLNTVHFAQVLGSAGAKKYVAVLTGEFPGTAPIDVTADAAVNTVRPTLFGAQVRGRYTIVNVGGASFTFALTGYAL